MLVSADFLVLMGESPKEMSVTVKELGRVTAGECCAVRKS